MRELLDAFRAGTSPTWGTVLQASISFFVVGIYVGALIMAVALR